MLTYEELINVCSRSNIDPTKSGNNIEATTKPTGHDLFDLKSIDFPQYELDQINKIGELIYNVFSQKTSGVIEFKSKEDLDNNAIEKILPIAEDSIESWLKQGLDKSKKPKNSLTICNGKVYESNPKFFKEMNEMDKRLMEFRRYFRRKQAASEESARHFIITC